MKFLPNEKVDHIRVQVNENVGVLSLNNLVISLNKRENKVTIERKEMDLAIVDGNNTPIEKRYFYLKQMEYVDIAYSYDNSCVELSFNDGEVFASLLNIKKCSGVVVKTSGLTRLE